MKWFKHDANASQDAKLEKLRIRYGVEGYGLYWYCLELVAQNVDEHNLTFELEHDAEILSHRLGLNIDHTQEMMTFMVELGLFENRGGVITCLKMLKRLDQSMTSSPKFRKAIDQAKKSHDPVMIESCQNHDPVMREEKRIDKNRIDKTRRDVEEKTPSTTAATTKTVLPADWQPHQATLDILKQHGIPTDYIQYAADEFRLYWIERQEPREAWQSKFLTSCTTNWTKNGQAQQAQKVTKGSPTNRPLRETTVEENLNDRSWAQ